MSCQSISTVVRVSRNTVVGVFCDGIIAPASRAVPPVSGAVAHVSRVVAFVSRDWLNLLFIMITVM